MRKVIVTIAFIAILESITAYSYEIGELEIHGFASTGYLISDNNNFFSNTKKGSFEFTEAALNISTVLTDNIRAGLQIYSYDLGDMGNNSLELDWAFLDCQLQEALGVRVGKIKTPLGLYNEVQDYDLLYTPILLPQGVYVKYARETIIATQGLGIYGTIPLGPGGRISYDTVLGTTNIHSDRGIAKLNSTAVMIQKDAKVNFLYGGRLKWNTPLKDLLFSFSGVEGDLLLEFEMAHNPNIRFEATSSNYRFLVYSSEYSIGNFTLAGEYWRMDGEMDIKMQGMPNIPSVRENMNRESWYTQISYRLTDWFEAGTYYCESYHDKYDRGGEKQRASGMPEFKAWRKDWAISTRFDLTDFWLLKLEAHFLDGVAWCAEADNPDGFEERYWNLFAIKTTFNF